MQRGWSTWIHGKGWKRTTYPVLHAFRSICVMYKLCVRVSARACVCVCIAATCPSGVISFIGLYVTVQLWRDSVLDLGSKKMKVMLEKKKKSIGRCRGFGSTNNICCIKTKNLNPQLCLSEHEQQLRAHCWRFAATSAAELGSQRVVHFSECFVCYTKKKKSPCLWKEMPRIA